MSGSCRLVLLLAFGAPVLGCGARSIVQAGVAGARLVQPLGQDDLDRVKKSFLLQTADYFSLVSATEASARIDRIADIERPLQRITTRLEQIVGRQSASAAAGDRRSLKVNVSPELRGVVSDPQTGQITFGLAMVEASFLATLTDIWKDESFRREYKSVLREDQPLTTQWPALVAELRAVTLPSTLSLIVAGEEAQKKYEHMYSLLGVSSALEERYYGSLAFVIAHEMGHVWLHHPSSAMCDEQPKIELQADRFAGSTLAEVFIPRSIEVINLAREVVGPFVRETKLKYLLVPTESDFTAAFYVQAETLEHYSGFATFLGTAIEAQRPEGSCYPEPKARMDEVRAGQDAILASDGRRLLEEHVKNLVRKQTLSSVVDALTGVD